MDTLNKSKAKNEVVQTTTKVYIKSDDIEEHPTNIRNRDTDSNELQLSTEDKISSSKSTNEISNNNNENSSTDSYGSSFIPAGPKISKLNQCTSDALNEIRHQRQRSSSTCSMPEFARISSFYFNNSESMPNIASNVNIKLLTSSQLNSSSSLSESDNMSEQSGYVSSRKSSAGSTTQVTPTG